MGGATRGNGTGDQQERCLCVAWIVAAAAVPKMVTRTSRTPTYPAGDGVECTEALGIAGKLMGRGPATT